MIQNLENFFRIMLQNCRTLLIERFVVIFIVPHLFCLPFACLLVLQETEQYISQLEGDNKVPAGKQLIRYGFHKMFNHFIPHMLFIAQTGSWICCQNAQNNKRGKGRQSVH